VLRLRRLDRRHVELPLQVFNFGLDTLEREETSRLGEKPQGFGEAVARGRLRGLEHALAACSPRRRSVVVRRNRW